MKTMKKVLSLILSMLMILSLAVPVVGAGDGTTGITLKVNNPVNSNVSIVGKTFYAYKIFDVTYADTNNDGKIDTNDSFSYTINTTNSWFTVITAYMSVSANSDGNYVSSDKGITLQKTHDANVYNVVTTNSFDARAFADALVKANNEKASPITTTITATGEKEDDPSTKEFAVFNNLESGYYLITSDSAINKDAAEGKQEVVAAASLSNILGASREIEMKIGAPDIDKVIVGADSAPTDPHEGKGTAVNVGDTVDFKLTSVVPDTNGYTTYKFLIMDELSDGLDLVLPEDVNASPFTVKIIGAGTGNTDVTVDLKKANNAEGCTGDNWFYNSTDRTISISIAMLETNADGKTVAKYPAGNAITVTYQATLNKTALNTDFEYNTVNLEYSNSPYSEGTGKTTDKNTYVYDFEIVIDKYEKPEDPNDAGQVDAAKRLQGADFVLYKIEKNDDGTDVKKYYKCDNNTKKVTWEESIESATKVTTDVNGSAKFAGLDAGTYYLQETKAPTGYNPLTEDKEVTITAAYDENGKLKTGDGSGTNVTPISSATEPTKTIGYQIEADVENSSGSELPETGGIGTTIFYVVGGIMMVVAVVLLVTKKKMSSKK